MNLQSNFSFDIDGTISDYPDYWLKFLSARAGIEFSTTLSAKSALGLDLYEEYKTQWRLGSEKYEIPVRSELLKLADLIYDSGGRVFINSRRPFSLFPQMREKTIDWLNRNGLKFEDVGPKTLTSLSKQQVICHLDDEPKEAFRLMGVPTLSRVFLICKDEHEFTHKSLEVQHSKLIIPTLLDRVVDTCSQG